MGTFVLLCLSALAIYVLATLAPDLIPLWQASEAVRFTLSSVFILLTLALIPLSLRLFRFGFIARDLIKYKEQALLKWGLTRMLMLDVLLLANLVLYYLLGEEPTFGWLALILLLVQPFIVPTMTRCKAETTPETEGEAETKESESSRS